MNQFEQFIENSTLATESVQDMVNELDKRRHTPNPFPLHVFHNKIRPFLALLHQKYDLPKAYIGLSLLSVYSTAIGTGYAIEQGKGKVYFPIWGCLEGISSSGKSLAIDTLYAPLQGIQDNFDKDWLEIQDRTTEDKLKNEMLKTVLFRDSHIATLVRSVMPDAPKGVCKQADEIMEWINGMNQTSNKVGIDEQFWLSAWNARNYSGIRSGKQKFVLPRVFVNVLGGIQPSITYKLFAKDRDTTGFIFRVLFASPDQNKIAQPDSGFQMPEELLELHKNSVEKLYNNLEVNDPYDEPYTLSIHRDASKMLEQWKSKRIKQINQLESIHQKDIHSGILGKMNEYALRFAGILNITDQYFNDPKLYFKPHDIITTNEMTRALELADYFYESAAQVYERVNESIIAPPEVLRYASYMHARMSYQKIGDLEFKNLATENARKKKAERVIKDMIRKYPKVFRAQEK